MLSRRRVPKLGWDVRFGSLADILTNPRHVRFTPRTDVGQGKLHTHRSPVRLKRVDAPISMNLIQLSAWPCWRWLLGRVFINRQQNADLDAPPTSVIGVKRTWRGLVSISANDPKRTFVLHGGEHNRGHWPGFASASSTPDLVTPSISLARTS
jgi:hypothetical protein